MVQTTFIVSLPKKTNKDLEKSDFASVASPKGLKGKSVKKNEVQVKHWKTSVKTVKLK